MAFDVGGWAASDSAGAAASAVSGARSGSEGEGADGVDCVDGVDATAPDHLSSCLWCYRFYLRTMQDGGWHVTGASLGGRRHKCSVCGWRAPVLRLPLTRTRFVRREHLTLDVCRSCGHVEPSRGMRLRERQHTANPERDASSSDPPRPLVR